MQRISSSRTGVLGTWAGGPAHVPAHVVGGGVVGLTKVNGPPTSHHLGRDDPEETNQPTSQAKSKNRNEDQPNEHAPATPTAVLSAIRNPGRAMPPNPGRHPAGHYRSQDVQLLRSNINCPTTKPQEETNEPAIPLPVMRRAQRNPACRG